MEGGAGRCVEMQGDAGRRRGLHVVQWGCSGDAGGCSGAKAAAAKPAAAKADFSRPRQPMADKVLLISAVQPASLMHFLCVV